MTRRTKHYQIVPYTKMRRAVTANLRSFQRKPVVHGLIEVDVTKARAVLRERKARTGESLSFTAFIIGCVAKAVDENRFVQAYRWGRKRLVVFDDVDVAIVIERDVAEQKIPLLYVIHAEDSRRRHDPPRWAGRRNRFPAGRLRLALLSRCHCRGMDGARRDRR